MKKITFKKFSSNFCGPCKMIKPIWDEIKNEYSKLFNFVEIDCDTDDEQVEKRLLLLMRMIMKFRESRCLSHKKEYLTKSESICCKTF